MKKFTRLLFFLFFISPNLIFSQDIEIYVCDAGNFNNPPWQILKFDENGQNPEVFINEHLAWPQDIVFLESDGTVLVSNLNSGVIARYNASTGAYIDNFATGIGGPTRMSIGPDHLLYVLQWAGNGLVYRYELDGTFVDQFTNLGVAQSIGLDWDNDNNLYVSSFNGGSVRKFDSSGNDQGLFINSNLQGPTNIWFVENGDMLVNDWSGDAIKRFDSNGNFIGNFATGLSQTEGVDYLPNGNLLIGNGGTSSVKMYDTNGNFIEDLIMPTAGGLIRPNAVIVRGDSILSSIDEISLETNYVFPTVGTQFMLRPSANSSITAIEVYNVDGILIEKKQMRYSDNLAWDAEKYSEGFYFITLINSKGVVGSQKVIVNKNK